MATEPSADLELRIAASACKVVLTKLQVLSDAPTSHVRTDGQLVHGTGAAGLRTRQAAWQEEGSGGRGDGLAVKGTKFSTSRVPEGVDVERDVTADNPGTPKEASLWAHYSEKMNAALRRKDAATLIKLAACATRDYEVYTRKRTTQHESHEVAVTELLRDCAGMPAVEASWWLGASIRWVQDQRFRHGKDREFGLAREKLDELTERVLELRLTGKTLVAIAAEVNMSKSAVHRVIQREVSRAA